MASLNIQSQQLPYQSLTQLSQDQRLYAQSLAQENGNDDVMFKVGGDLLVASGDNMPVDKLEVGSTFQHDGQQAEIVFVDDQINSFGDGLKWGNRNLPYMAAVGVGFAAVAAGTVALGGASAARTLTVGAQILGFQAAVSGALTLGVASYGALRGGEDASLKALAQ